MNEAVVAGSLAVATLNLLPGLTGLLAYWVGDTTGALARSFWLLLRVGQGGALTLAIAVGSLAAAGNFSTDRLFYLYALLPLAIGVIAILGTFAELDVLGSVTNVAIYAINLTTALGLALAIDYALLMVSRFREAISAGHDGPAASLIAARQAGRTLLISASTVAIGFLALLTVPISEIRSIGIAGFLVARLVGCSAVGIWIASSEPNVSPVLSMIWQRFFHSPGEPVIVFSNHRFAGRSSTRLADANHTYFGERHGEGGGRAEQPVLAGRPDAPPQAGGAAHLGRSEGCQRAACGSAGG